MPRRRYRVTPGMRNALSRMRLRGECPGCGLPLPVLRGRRPGTCPNCGTRLFSDEVEEQIEEAVIAALARMLAEDWPGTSAGGIYGADLMNMAGDKRELGIDSRSRAGVTFDKLMQYIGVKKLLDQFLGVEVEGDGALFKMYFSDAAQEGVLQEFAEELRGITASVEIKPTSEVKDAKWEVILYQPSVPDEAAGDQPAIPMQGAVEIKNQPAGQAQPAQQPPARGF